MNKQVLILDSSMVCTWLGVPGMDVTGPKSDPWDQGRIQNLIDVKKTKGFIFILPIAALIETGNHIAQTSNVKCANLLMELLKQAINGDSPWGIFNEQSIIWEPPNIERIVAEWPDSIKHGVSFGDFTIELIAQFYMDRRFEVEILTSDQGLQDRARASSRLPKPRRSNYQS
ncbi:MAG: hypothetical protein HXX12_16115 [Geothrix sp.]|uniref:hypothetical protein n=1 Tax=Geothrix sp. TaxID=1962974 RepID=UPI00178F69E9|nr:hypothetical protein [Geothrix sp.]NWJ42487.1 hypothetical protein [Geothrix sp.]WIL19550.1 MAG: hypothetical protein QOZ81_002072 [Geothrix sp.]